MEQAALVALHGKIDRLNDNIDAVKEKQEEISEHIGKIKEAVYNPDSGLYARLRSIEHACDNILYIRKKLHKVDTRLEDCYTILNGFERVQKKIEEERDAQQAPLGVERVQDGSND